MRSKNFVYLAIALFVLVVVGAVAFAYGGGDSRSDNAPVFDHAPLSIQRADGKVFAYDAEVARTLEQDRYGLMFRKYLAENAGMIFLYQPEQAVAMWMKNTLIPLDMLFVRRDGMVVKIITNARPQDLTPLPSGEPVRAVIELNAGDVAKNGFKIGDKVLFAGLADRP